MAQMLINATILNNPRLTGLGVCAASVLPFLLREMSESKEVDEIVLLGDADRLGAILGEAVRVRGVRIRSVSTNHPVRRLIDLTRAVRSEMKRTESTLLYSPTHHGVLLGGLAQIITVHDLFARLFPDSYPMQSRYFRWYMPRLLRKTCRVIVDSECTASDLWRFFPNAPPAEVVYLGVRSDMCESTLRPVEDLLDVPYFLFIGPSYWYKNCERLIDAFAIFRKSSMSHERLVFVGGREPYREVLRKHLYAKHTDVAGEVIFLDYVTDEELAWLY